MKTLLAPILMKRGASLKFPIFLEPYVLIRDFSIEEREEFFKVKNLKVEGTGVTYSLAENTSFISGGFMARPDFNSLLKAESCVEVKCSNKQKTIVLQNKLNSASEALKILKSGSTGYLTAKFVGNKRLIDFFPDAIIWTGINPLRGREYILNKKDIPELEFIFKTLLKRKNNKTRMFIDKFYLAVSKDLRRHMRALEFFSLLESLYLPGVDVGELSFRLSQRMAKMMYSGPSRFKKYKEIKELYKKRGTLIHQSKDEFSDDDLDELENLTRNSLKLFLKRPEVFNQEYLDKVLLN